MQTAFDQIGKPREHFTACFRYMIATLLETLAQHLDRRGVLAMHRYEKLGREKAVEFERSMAFGAKTMKNDEQMLIEIVEFREIHVEDGIFNRQLIEVESPKNGPYFVRVSCVRVGQVDPYPPARRCGIEILPLHRTTGIVYS